MKVMAALFTSWTVSPREVSSDLACSWNSRNRLPRIKVQTFPNWRRGNTQLDNFDNSGELIDFYIGKSLISLLILFFFYDPSRSELIRVDPVRLLYLTLVT